MPALQNILGKRFGRLVVIRKGTNTDDCAHWVCRCDCGQEKEIRGRNLREGLTKSCGCFWRENLKKLERKVTHGLSRHSLYHTWNKMLQRCYDHDHVAYLNYGGRGISVCDRWHDVSNFITDMAPKPKGHSLDRINNDGNYEPANCRWATPKEQAANQRKTPRTFYEIDKLKVRVAFLETKLEHFKALILTDSCGFEV